MTKTVFNFAFLVGLAVVIWMAANFVGSDALGLAMIALIGAVYVLGFVELVKYRQATQSLSRGLNSLNGPVNDLEAWVQSLDTSLHNSVRSRIEGEKVGLPTPVLTPYLVGLLVMLGLLGTFAGMVGTLKGAVFALEGTTELQAIREGLAAPMKGLGLAFGTSVAGVAASAMLGLLSTLSRRERMQTAQVLDQKIGAEFQQHSIVYQRQETYKALQSQATLLPDVAERLQSMATQIEGLGDKLATTLVSNQEALHASTQTLFSDLAASVESSLKTSLSESGKLAGESIQPIIEGAMSSISKGVSNSVENTNEALLKTSKDQLQAISEQFSITSESLLKHFDDKSADWLEASQSEDHKRLSLWAAEFEKVQQQSATQFTDQSLKLIEQLKQASVLQKESVADMTSELSQLMTSVQSAAEGLTQQNGDLSKAMAEESERLVRASEELIKQRMATEQEWLEGQNQRAELVATKLEEQLSGLRYEEEKRGAAAISRLEALEEKVALHLSTLGQSLEEPMQRLIETASETPKAAAEVIGHLRQEISKNIERDNDLLEERKEIVDSLSTMFGSMEQSTAGQREAIDQLITRSADTLKEVSAQFTDHVGGEVNKLTEMGDHFAGSALEMASLGDAFSLAVKLFSESNNQLIESLNRIEDALEHSSNRSDEQLGYYVAQAREIIDHSMLSQKELFEEIRQIGKGKAQETKTTVDQRSSESALS